MLRHAPTASLLIGIIPGRTALLMPLKFYPKALTASNSNEIIEAEFVPDENDDDDNEWVPDRERVMRAKGGMKRAIEVPQSTSKNNPNTADIKSQKKRLTYTEEEEELIGALGGRDKENPSPKRESGFLGDCTLKEIASDYQVPICYLADALCGWGVPPPIDTDAMLGDLCTGEMAFAILEAIHTLDMSAINEMYGDSDIITLCSEYDIELADGFDHAMEKGWNLPFGVRTVLRVEQEDDLIQTLAKDVY